jgi:tetratricopeptide (TPR) repeat protein
LTYASEEGQQLLSWAWQLGDLEGCIQLAERWLAAAQLSEVEGVSLETRIAACLIRLGKLSDAEARLSRVLNEHLANDFDAPDNLGYAYLQLGNARRYLGNADDARTAFDSSLEQAEATRDGGLAIASHTALGELSLDETALEQAIGSLGKGLGLTEFFRDERLTIAPLAALAHAHALWKNPSKSYDLVNRALARARPSVDRVGSARAKLASATAALSRAPKPPNTAYSFVAAYEDARVAPHVPLALRIATSDLEQRARGVLIDAENVVKDAQHVLQQLNTCGMMPQVRQLKALIDNLNS